ncbi:MAG: G/U mismatch-specific DNA glycosylase [Chloroflexi bacterium]|nr:G/U mismatch-specific DNA glycosylase [Chloroflexota bacterium]
MTGVPGPRPTAAGLAAAAGRTIPDVVAPGLRVLFCGINPGLYSGASGHHFARPGNRFWRALHEAGFTDRLLQPSEQEQLLASGIGVTNLVPRTTAAAAELTGEELRAGARRLRGLVATLAPQWLAVLGVTAYRSGFEERAAAIGPQPVTIGRTRVWLLPNPSGRNAHEQLPDLVRRFRELRSAIDASSPG